MKDFFQQFPLIISMIVSIQSLSTTKAIYSNTNPQCISRANVDNIHKPINAIFSSLWFGGYCYNFTSPTSTCNQAQLNKWDRQSFTIHGFWPQAKTNRPYGKFNISYVKQDNQLYFQMKKYWQTPWNSDTQDRFWVWDHEYNKHGIIYSNILQHFDPKGYQDASDRSLQQKYFRQTLDLYHSFNLQNFDFGQNHQEKSNPILTKNELGEKIGVDEKYFVVNCKIGSILRAVKICLQIQKNLSLTLKQCQQIDERGETKNPLRDDCQGNTLTLIKNLIK